MSGKSPESGSGQLVFDEFKEPEKKPFVLKSPDSEAKLAKPKRKKFDPFGVETGNEDKRYT